MTAYLHRRNTLTYLLLFPNDLNCFHFLSCRPVCLFCDMLTYDVVISNVKKDQRTVSLMLWAFFLEKDGKSVLLWGRFPGVFSAGGCKQYRSIVLLCVVRKSDDGWSFMHCGTGLWAWRHCAWQTMGVGNLYQYNTTVCTWSPGLHWGKIHLFWKQVNEHNVQLIWSNIVDTIIFCLNSSCSWTRYWAYILM